MSITVSHCKYCSMVERFNIFQVCSIFNAILSYKDASTYSFPPKLKISKPTSHVHFLYPAPCVPMGVSVMMDCTKNEAYVSWNASQGALYYLAFATSRYNNIASCNSSSVNTHCILKALTCGAVYAVQVVAVGDECRSLPSLAVDFRSGMRKVRAILRWCYEIDTITIVSWYFEIETTTMLRWYCEIKKTMPIERWYCEIDTTAIERWYLRWHCERDRSHFKVLM